MPIEPILLFNIQYRLSRVHSTGVELQTYNRIILFNKNFTSRSAYFVEGFNAFEFIVEGYRATWSFRKQTLTPQMIYDFDRFKVIGSEMYLLTIRSRLSLTPAPFGLKVNEEHDVFSCNLRDVDASWGEQIDAYNSVPFSSITNIEFYDRDVRSVNRQRNILGERAKISPTPAPEPLTEMLLEKV